MAGLISVLCTMNPTVLPYWLIGQVTQTGSVNNDLVSNLDFAQTFLDMAGTPPKRHARSQLVPLLKGKKPTNWRKYHYYHYYEYPGWHMVHRHERIRRPL